MTPDDPATREENTGAGMPVLGDFILLGWLVRVHYQENENGCCRVTRSHLV